MTKRKLFISGRGVSVALPDEVLKSLNMTDASTVHVSVRNGTIHLRPSPIVRMVQQNDVVDTEAAALSPNDFA